MKKMLLLLFVLLLLPSYALAGKPTKLEGQQCDTGQVVVGIDANNQIICQDISTFLPIDVCTSTPPVVDNISYSPTTNIYAGDRVVLDITTSDYDGDPLTISSEFIELPPFSQAELTSNTGSSPAFIPDYGGIYTVRVTVSDDTGCKSERQITINVLSYERTL